ncbi:MAG: hypothetical protein KIT14_07410 [bacterium]|nr:hypothetical protein [bacterium]
MQGLLNRQEARRGMERIQGPTKDVLLDELCWGLRLFQRCGHSAHPDRVSDSALRLFWLFLEALDSVDELMRAGLVEPAAIQARTMLDVGLQLLYVVKRNDERVAAAYTTSIRRRSLKAAQLLTKGGEMRRELAAIAKKTHHLPDGFVDRFRDTAAEAKRIKATLSSPDWKEANDELERLKDPDRWFKAFGGPQNLPELARFVGLELWVRVFTNQWNGITHGLGGGRVFRPGAEGGVVPAPLRSPGAWEALLDTTHSLNVLVFRAMIARFREGEDPAFLQWLDSDVLPRFPKPNRAGKV